MGPMEDLLKMIPGMANNPALQNMKVDERQIARKRAIVSSMTPEEREKSRFVKSKPSCGCGRGGQKSY